MPVQQSQPIAPPIQPQPMQPQMPLQQMAPNQDPGATLGLIGLISAFVFCPLGVALGIIGFMKSKKAGFKNNKALAGIIVGSVFMAISLIIVISAFSSVNKALDDFKKDCASKNGTYEEEESGSYKCEYIKSDY